MADQEVANSTPAAAADAVQAESRSPEPQETSPQPDLWHRLFGAITGKGKTESDAATADATEAEDATSTLTLTKAELDRRIQAETDRREAKRQREAAEASARQIREDNERQSRERLEQLERKLTPGDPLYDPYGATEEREKLKAEQQSAEQFTGLFQTVSQQHDAATLDVIVEALPQPERERIFKLEGAGVGLDGRRLIVSEGLKALQKHWKAEGAKEAEANLRGDSTFRKRLFHEHRDEVEEPELVVGTPANGRGDFMQQLQSEYKSMKGRH